MSNLISLAFPVDTILKQAAISKLLDTNAQTLKYGLCLSDSEASQIIQSRDEALKTVGRIELGAELVNQIISVFCHSPYINQADYADTISWLVELFYCMKNESVDEIADDDLINIMKDYFDNKCFGSMELLVKELEAWAIDVKRSAINKMFIRKDEE